MVNARNMKYWTVSPSMLFGLSPEISYRCGACGKRNETRMSLESVKNHKPYTVCAYCGEINNTGIKIE